MRAALFLSATLIVTPAYAQRVNDQYNDGDAAASVVVSTDDAGQVGATAVASGNVITAVSDDIEDAEMENVQHMDGATSASADVTAWYVEGAVAVTTAAVANGATGEIANGSADINSTQLAHGDASASTTTTTGNAGDVGASASASGNVAALSAEYADVRLISTQESTGAVSANVESDNCCVAGQVVSGAIASSNNMSIAGYTSTVLTHITQNASGSATARSDLYAGYATDASGNATANANAVTLDNQWGYVNARITQDSSANVSADSYVTLGGDFLGFGSAGAYGVGNQALVTNVGSDTVVDTMQNNTGDISANAALAGEGGGMALASSAAYGNNVGVGLCSYCDTSNPSINATNYQSNGGDVSSSAVVISPRAGTVAATATAIGNAATYQSTGPGGG